MKPPLLGWAHEVIPRHGPPQSCLFTWALVELRKLNPPQHPLNLGLHFSENPACELFSQVTTIMEDEMRVYVGGCVT